MLKNNVIASPIQSTVLLAVHSLQDILMILQRIIAL